MAHLGEPCSQQFLSHLASRDPFPKLATRTNESTNGRKYLSSTSSSEVVKEDLAGSAMHRGRGSEFALYSPMWRMANLMRFTSNWWYSNSSISLARKSVQCKEVAYNRTQEFDMNSTSDQTPSN